MWLTGGNLILSIVVLIAFVGAYVFAMFFSERVLQKLDKDQPSGQ